MTQIILFGNDKGGSGKTTTAMHFAILMSRYGYNVVTADFDCYQQSFTTYIENRARSKERDNLNITIPKHYRFIDIRYTQYRKDKEKLEFENIVTKYVNQDASHAETEAILQEILDENPNGDFIVIDSPGSSVSLSRNIHSFADKIITPINESFIDIELLGRIDGHILDSTSPGPYAVMVFEQRSKGTERKGKPPQWFVMKNRISHIDTINSQKIEATLYKLSKKLGFKITSGFGNRNIFKELFPFGLSVLDTDVPVMRSKISTSSITARLEVIEFAKEIGISLEKSEL